MGLLPTARAELFKYRRRKHPSLDSLMAGPENLTPTCRELGRPIPLCQPIRHAAGSGRQQAVLTDFWR